jgi:hypothetical protein
MQIFVVVTQTLILCEFLTLKEISILIWPSDGYNYGIGVHIWELTVPTFNMWQKVFYLSILYVPWRFGLLVY